MFGNRGRPVRVHLLGTDAVDDLLEHFWGRGDTDVSREGGTWLPPVDVSETAEALLVTVEVPGVESERMSISVDGDLLTIKGEKHIECDGNEQWHRFERPCGSFERTFRLPAVVAADKVSADYRDGVLRIVLPKARSLKPRKIAIGGA